MTERYIVTIFNAGKDDKHRIIVLDQKAMRLVHDKVYAGDLLNVVKNMFIEYYGRNEVRFTEGTGELPLKAQPSE